MNKLIIIGASGHGKVVAEIASLNGYKDIAFLDDFSTETHCAGFPIVGKTDDIPNFKNCKFFIGIGSNLIRERISRLIDDFEVVTLIHPSATISKAVEVGKGTVIMAGTVVNTNTKIGNYCIINTSTSVDHDCILENYSHVSVGSHVAGTVFIGSKVWIGAGSVISNNVNIFPEIFIGTGTVVIKNLTEKGTYVGNPARKIK
ncbi:acetyltransferase [Streptococcus porcinus]|uniref:Acetyltransferase n=1 Tax=Streptococcus porcinus TaxID=1340 RepID=A0A7W0AST1_STRPO|nr:acetyltransferase [Streptococcus porcinus]MBA2796624.1 acetyltransferase [Streptococcus porcinus]